jgi:HSP20 family protein
MVRRNHRSIYDELDELKASMDYLFQLALEPTEYSLLQNEDTDEIVCGYLHTVNAEVTVLDEEVIVTLDIMPGMDMTEISVELIDPGTLKISCDQREEDIMGIHGNNLHEQRSFSLNHLISLPVPVTKRGARATLKNGVLDLQLKKAAQS